MEEAQRRLALQRGEGDAAGDPDWQDTWAQSIRVHLSGYSEASPFARAAMEHLRRNISGDGPISPASDVLTCGIEIDEGGPSVSYLISGPGYVGEHRATIPAGAHDGDIFEFVAPAGERLYNVTVADEDRADNAILVDPASATFRVIGDRTETTTFAFTAPPQALVPMRRARFARRDAAFRPGPIITDLSA